MTDGGVNFSVCAENATAVELLLFDGPDAGAPARVIPLVPDFHFWHAFVPGAGRADDTALATMVGPFKLTCDTERLTKLYT